MKKILFSILTVLGVGLSFCSAEDIYWNALDSQPMYDSSFFVVESGFYFNITGNSDQYNNCRPNYPIYNSVGNISFSGLNISGLSLTNICFRKSYSTNYSSYSINLNGVSYGNNLLSWSNDNSYFCLDFSSSPIDLSLNNSFSYNIIVSSNSMLSTICYYPFSTSYFYNGAGSGLYYFKLNDDLYFTSNFLNNTDTYIGLPLSFSVSYDVSGCPDPDPQEITIHYNNNQSSTTISCDGNPDLYINGLSTITSTNTFTPYFNITYRDEDNQLITESYDKINLYLSGALFKKTYTGNNDWILTVQGGNNSDFNGYLPTFDVTGEIQDVSTSGNVFNNFVENSLIVLLSNIPSYIQYVIIILILLFILGFIKKIRRRR